MKKIESIKRILLGLGLDCDDGRKRITVGGNFRLYGGSKSTHEEMKEKSIKFNEQLKKRHKTLDTANRKEIYDIAHKIGLEPFKNLKGDENNAGSKKT